MAYSILRYEPIYTKSDMGQRYMHNVRRYNVKNADPEKTGLNEQLISTNGMSFERIYRDTVNELTLQGSQKRKIRRDAILGFEIIIRYSREVYAEEWEKENGKFDEEGWKQASLEWLDRSFNPEGHRFVYTDKEGNEKTGRTGNVKSAVVHYDEGSPHIHAFIVPVDDKGKLNASFYLERGPWHRWHDSFNEKMKQFHLMPGEKYSVATPEQHAKYQNEIVRAVSPGLPDVRDGESAEEYKKRAERVFVREKCHHRDDVVKMNQKVVKAKSHETIAEKKAEGLKEEVFAARSFFKAAIGKEAPSDSEIRSLVREIRDSRKLDRGLGEYPDREFADSIRKGLDDIMHWYGREEEKAERKKEKGREKIIR